MRIRTVKPEWLDDERMAAASDVARVMSIALILMADDYGNGRAHETYVASHVWSYSQNPRESLEKSSGGLRELVGTGFLTLYEVHGQRYYHVTNWSRHQRVDKPGKPRVPGPGRADNVVQKAVDETSGECWEPPGKVPGGLAPDPDQDPDQDPDPDRTTHARAREREADQSEHEGTPGGLWRDVLVELRPLTPHPCKPIGVGRTPPPGLVARLDESSVSDVVETASSFASIIRANPRAPFVPGAKGEGGKVAEFWSGGRLFGDKVWASVLALVTSHQLEQTEGGPSQLSELGEKLLAQEDERA